MHPIKRCRRSLARPNWSTPEYPDFDNCVAVGRPRCFFLLHPYPSYEAWADDAAEHRIHGVNEYRVFSILEGDMMYDVVSCVGRFFEVAGKQFLITC